MITKNQIIEIADVLKNLPTFNSADGEPACEVADIVCAFCEFFKNENPRFMEERFRGYVFDECGPNGGKG